MKATAATIVAIVLLLSLQGFTAAQTMPDMQDRCAHDATIQSLLQCVEHARDQGYIDRQGVALSLLAKVNAAQDAFDLGQTQTAINTLQAFIYAVNAQGGLHIDQTHANHLITHAAMVVQALQ